ncbi:MAG: peptidoglycan editing factor PgeF [Pseudomonadota bacterium]
MIQAPDLDASPLRHGFFTRTGGHSHGLYVSLNCGLGSDDDRDHVLWNRRRVTERLGVAEDHLVTVYQVHSATAVSVDAPFEGQPPKADALVTKTPGLAIGVLTADCAPILFADPEASVVGAAHAGWKGAMGGIAEATVDAMVDLGADRARISAVIGPTISRYSYEVGPEFVDRLIAETGDNRRFLSAQSETGHAYFDLPGYLVARLDAAGIRSVRDLGRCTYSDEDQFFSYRRATHRGEPDYGRQISVIAVQPDTRSV